MAVDLDEFRKKYGQNSSQAQTAQQPAAQAYEPNYRFQAENGSADLDALEKFRRQYWTAPQAGTITSLTPEGMKYYQDIATTRRQSAEIAQLGNAARSSVLAYDANGKLDPTLTGINLLNNFNEFRSAVNGLSQTAEATTPGVVKPGQQIEQYSDAGTGNRTYAGTAPGVVKPSQQVEAYTDTGTGNRQYREQRRAELQQELDQIAQYEGWIIDPDEANRVAARKKEINEELNSLKETGSPTVTKPGSGYTAEEVQQMYGIDYELEEMPVLSRLLGHSVYKPAKDVTLGEVHGLDKDASFGGVIQQTATDAYEDIQGVKDRVNDAAAGNLETGNETIDNWGDTLRVGTEAARMLSEVYGIPTASIEGSNTQENLDAFQQQYEDMSYGQKLGTNVGMTAADYALSMINAGLVGADLLSGGKIEENSIFQMANFAQNAGSGMTSEAFNSMREGTNWLGRLVLDLEKTGVEQVLDRMLSGGMGLVPMGIRVFGSGAQEAENRGENVVKQAETAFARSGVEIATEMLSGVGGSWRGTGYGEAFLNKVDKWIASKTGSELLGTLGNAFTGEALEEMIADVLNPLMDRILGIGEATGRGEDKEFMQQLSDFLVDVWGDGQLLYDGLLGGLAGMGGGAVAQVEYSAGARNLAVDVATYKAAQRIAENNSLKEKFTELTGVTLSENSEEALMQVAMYLTNVSQSTEGNPNAREVETNLYRMQRTGNEQAAAESAVEQTEKVKVENRTQVMGNMIERSARAARMELSDGDIRVLSEGYEAGTDGRTYAAAALEAYQMGQTGKYTMQEARKASAYKGRLSEAQFRRAWQLGAGVATSAPVSVDASTEKGKAALTSSLAALGSHAEAAAAVYESGQDVKRFAAGMSEAAERYAATGTDIRSQEGGIPAESMISTLTDAQIEKAQEIGAQLRTERKEAVKRLDARRAEIRTQAASLQQASEADAQALAEVEKQIREANRLGAETVKLFESQRNALEAAVKADPEFQNSEEYERAFDEAKANMDKAVQLQKDVQALEARKKELEGSKPVKRKKGSVSFDGGNIDGTDYKGIDRDSLSRQQKNIVAMVERLADLINIDYVFFDGPTNLGGAYVRGGTVYININSGMTQETRKSLAAASLSHELTHFMQEYAPSEYQELKDYVIKAVLKKSPAEFDRLVQQQRRWEPGKSYEELTDELVANACQTMLTDDRAVQRMARENMTLAQKVADVLDDITEKIRAAFEGMSFDENRAIYAPVRAVMDEIEGITERWANGIAAAVENYNAEQTVRQAQGKENTAPEGGVQYQAWSRKDINRAFIDYRNTEARKRAEVSKTRSLVDRGKVVTIPEETLKRLSGKTDWGNLKKAREAIKGILKDTLGDRSVHFFFDGGTMTAYLTSDGRNHSAGGLADLQRGALFSEVASLIDNAEYIYSSKHDVHSESSAKSNGNTEWDSFLAVANIEGKYVPVIFSVKTTERDTRSLIHAIFENKKGALSHDAGLKDQGGQSNYGDTAPYSENIVAAVTADVKENDAPAGAESRTQLQMWDDEEYNTVVGNRTASELLDELQSEREQQRNLQRQLRDRNDEYQERLQKAIQGGDRELKAFAKWARESGYDDLYNQKKEADRRVNILNAAYDKARDAEMEAEEQRDIEKSGLPEAEYFGKQAVKTFGYTPYYYDAGYIVPNGKMLNFSGEKGRHFGTRGEDHRAIGQIFATTQGSEAMVRFMGYGNIRIMAEAPGLDIISSTEPTEEQYRAIRAFARNVADEEYFNVDLTDSRGNTIGTLEYEGTIRPDRIVNDIKYYFQTGEVREAGIGAFFQRWDDTSDDTAAERNGRELAYARLQNENAILTETVAEMKKLSAKQGKTIEALQKKMQITKTPETRQSDAKKLARSLIREYGSRADTQSVAEKIKAVGDYILQTPAAELDENNLKTRARSVAVEILASASQTVDEGNETLRSIAETVRGSKLSLDSDFIGELNEDFESFRKRNFGNFILAQRESKSRESREGYRSVDQFYNDLQGEYGESYFPDMANEGEQLRRIAEVMDLSRPMEVNPFEQYMGEAAEDLANRITMDAMDGVLRANEPTTADKQKARTKALQEQIQQLKAEKKLDAKEAASLYRTIYDLSVALDKAESRYTTLRTEADYRAAQLRAEGSARATEIQAKERERAARQIAELKKHYKEIEKRARERRNNTGVRRKIRDLIDDLNRRLAKPSEKKYVPTEFVRLTVDVLDMIDFDSGRGGDAFAQKIQQLRTMYDSYRQNPTYAAVFDDVAAEMLRDLSVKIGDTKLYEMNTEQLEAVYNTLKALTHIIDDAVKIRIGNEERNAFEVAQTMTQETRDIPKAQKGWAKQHYIPAHLRPDVAFRRFAGFKKNSAWESMCRMLNDGQLKQTEITMKLSLPFAELVNDSKAMRDFSGLNYLGNVDQKKLIDIGLKDESGNAIPVTHGIAAGIYMDLLNEDNRRHFIRGGKTIPNLSDFYSGKGGFGIGTQRAVGIASELSELYHEQREAKSAGDEALADEIQERIEELELSGETYADTVKANIERQLTDFDRKWIRATQQLMDTDSKRYLNETTMEVYGIEKAQVENYYPITSDPNFLASSFEAVTRDMNLENAGFMKERVKSGNPSLALDISSVVNNQIQRVAQYSGLMPAIRNFNKVWNKMGSGYSDSLKNAVNATFGKEGGQYVENLIADLTGSRGVGDDSLGLNRLMGRLRGNLAQTTLTLNVRVALAQMASYPTAAAEVGSKALTKAFFRGGKSGRMISRADAELIAKYSPLLWYRMQGYSSVELGDIKNSQRLSSRVWKKARWATGWIQAVDGATVGRLWYAAEYWVQDNKPNLEKGSDAYYEAVAEKFNDVVEKTQPNYTTMQRPQILRDPNELVRALTMFMTQRLQNFNILFDAAGGYQKAHADFANKRNGVTKADVTEARTQLVSAVSSQLTQAAVYVGFKLLADALLHNMKAYRDDDDGELTAESVSLRVLDNYIDAMAGMFLGGSELHSILMAATGNGNWYGLSLSGVDSVNDLIDNLVTLASTKYDLNDEKSKAKFEKQLSKVGLSLCQYLGIPANNAIKIKDALLYHIEDIRNGEFGRFEAGYERTKAQSTDVLIRALESGDDAAVQKATEAFESEKAAFSAVKSQLKKDFEDGKRTAEQVAALLEKTGVSQNDAFFTVQSWETGDSGKYTAVKRAALAGDQKAFKSAMTDLTSHGVKEKTAQSEIKTFVRKAYFGDELSAEEQEILGEKMLSDAEARRLLSYYAGLTVDEANETVAEWRETRSFIRQHGAEYEQYDLSVTQAKYFYDRVKNTAGITLRDYASQVDRYGTETVKAYYGDGDGSWRETGLTIDQYATYKTGYAQCKGTDLDGDGKTDSGSKKAEVMRVIDALPVSNAVKDALYRKNGWSEKTIYEAPWRN